MVHWKKLKNKGEKVALIFWLPCSPIGPRVRANSSRPGPSRRFQRHMVIVLTWDL